MLLLLWFSICFSTAANAVLLRNLLRAVRAMLFVLRVLKPDNDFGKGQQAVKRISLHDVRLRAGEVVADLSSNVAKRVRSVSIKYETLRTADEFAGEDFQKKGTFTGVRSSVFSKSSAHKSHLARDAKNAYSRKAGRRLVQFFQSFHGREEAPNHVDLNTTIKKRLRAICPESFHRLSTQERIRTSTSFTDTRT